MDDKRHKYDSAALKGLGFDEGLYSELLPSQIKEFAIARVVSVHKNRFIISDGGKECRAEMAGRLLFNTETVFDYPAVGDWILGDFHNSRTFAVIHSILPRKSLLKRKTPGDKVDFQLIAANIDTAFIMQSLDHNFNPRRLERYLVMVNESNICPVVLLSKSDLVDPAEAQSRMNEIRVLSPDLQIKAFSNTCPHSLDALKGLLITNKTYCLLGSSGVGKTTLLNNLIGQDMFKTKNVREKDGKGRHATTSRQLIKLPPGAMIIDTPGMRELGNFSVEKGLDETFSDIKALSEKCKFSDCTHSHENGCAVLAAVKNGDLPEERLQNYLKINKEAAYHEMSYIEKRHKDKQFAKFCKQVMKQKKYRR